MGAVNPAIAACDRRRRHSVRTETCSRRLTRSGHRCRRVVHRYYDPVTEQFLSVDPLVDVTGTPYAFTGGDPVNGSDPTGLNIFSWVGHQVGALFNGVGSAISGNGSSWCVNQTNRQRRFACSGGVAIGDAWEAVAAVAALADGLRNPGNTVQDDEALAADAPLTESEIPNVIQSIFSGCSQEGGSSNLLQLYKSGGLTRAETDFAELTQGLSPSKSANGVLSARLSSGANVSIRAFGSGQNLPTLQINVPGAPPIKIRYEP